MRFLPLCLLLLCSISGFSQKGQEIDIITSAKVMKLGDVFNIKVYIRGNPNSNVKEFPKIEGFQKEGRSVSHANVKIGNKTVLQHIVTQNYKAINWGSFDLPEFEFVINGEERVMQAGELTVSNSENPEEREFTDTLSNEDALLFLFVDKKDIVVGESIRMNLAFYVSEDNTASWEFPKNLAYQIEQISNRLKPENCLESKREISNIEPEKSVINGKNYIKYKFFESIYYPLSQKNINLPSVRLDMDKLNIGKDSSRSVEVRAFYSRPYSIDVSALPEHQMKNRAAVGNFKLTEVTKLGSAKTGKVINYSIDISGRGNFKTMVFDKPDNDPSFDFYPPQSTLNQMEGYETGSKTFTFKVFPKDSGVYDFGNYFKWIFYNTATESYDTLRAEQKLSVSGPRIETYSGNSKEVYDDIENLSISEPEVNYRKIIKIVVNLLLFLMLVGMLFIFDFRRKRRQ